MKFADIAGLKGKDGKLLTKDASAAIKFLKAHGIKQGVAAKE